MPVPSQETEEWRYTDLSGFELDFAPYTPGGRAANLDDVPAHVLAAAGDVGDRSGLEIQHNSDAMLTHLDPALARKGVVFADLDAAAADASRPGRAAPPLARPDRPDEVHGAARRVPHRRDVPLRARRRAIELPLQTLTYLDADGAAVFPHTLIVVGANA